MNIDMQETLFHHTQCHLQQHLSISVLATSKGHLLTSSVYILKYLMWVLQPFPVLLFQLSIFRFCFLISVSSDSTCTFYEPFLNSVMNCGQVSVVLKYQSKLDRANFH